MRTNINGNRIWELDFFRGIALFLMIYFHIIFDLEVIYGYNINYSSGINQFIGKTSAISFILISAVSCSLSKRNIKRGLKIFGIAMIITILTHLYSSGLGVKFGILHFLGVCIVFSPLLQKLNKYLLVAGGIFIIYLGQFTTKIVVYHDFLSPFGIASSSFTSSDYYPLIPWLGIFLIGMALGKIFYPQKISVFSFSIRDNLISKAGRHTLITYIAHQPMILIILTLLSLLKLK
jgi:uncharacterized membrane protein